VVIIALVLVIKYSTKRTVLAWRGAYAPIAHPGYGPVLVTQWRQLVAQMFQQELHVTYVL